MGRKEVWQSLLGLPFFGLTPEYRKYIFSQIHDIVFHGNGGYDWHTVYNMPIWLRRFTLNSISDFYSKQKEEYDKVSKKSGTSIPKGPSVKNPTHTLKKPK